MAIITGDQLIAAFAAGNIFPWTKLVPSTNSQGVFFSTWTQQGNPVAGAIPTTAAFCTSATVGAVPFTNPTPPQLTYLGHFTFENYYNSVNQLAVLMKDRLSHMGGLSGTNTGVQSVNLTVPSGRLISTDLTNAEWFLECYSTLGATPQTLTVTYVNTSSVTNTVVMSIPASMAAGRVTRIIPTVPSDVIQSITSCQLSGSTGTAGNFGFTCARSILQASTVNASIMDIQDIVTTGLAQIADNSCLWFLIAASSDNWGGIGCNGTLKLIQG